MSARRLSKEEIKNSQKEKYERETKALVFKVKGLDENDLEKLAQESFNGYGTGIKMTKKKQGYIIHEEGLHPNKSEDGLLRIVPPNRMIVIGYGKTLTGDMIDEDIHFDYKHVTTSRKDVLEKKTFNC